MYKKVLILDCTMNSVNIFILLSLIISPFIYIPVVVKEYKQRQKRFIWYIITFLIGLIQTLIYLLLLFALGLPI